MNSNVYQVGIVGAGHVVSANHLPALKAMPNVNVAWIADKDFNRSQSVGKSLGVTACDIGRGLESLPKADMVLMAIPFGVRQPYYDVFEAMGTALYVEKPFARTVDAHRELCSRFEDSRIACGLNRRSWGIVQFCRNVLSSGIFGKVRRAKFGMGSLGGNATAASYMADAKMAGGGLLIETGVHGVDTVLYCLDAQSARLADGHMIMENGHDLHTDGEFILTTLAGDRIPFDIEVSRLKNTINRVEFQFDNCTLHFSLFGSPQLWVDSRDGKIKSLLSDQTDYYPFTWNQVLLEFWQTFIGGVQDGKTNYTSARESLLTTQVIEQLYSLAEGSKEGI